MSTLRHDEETCPCKGCALHGLLEELEAEARKLDALADSYKGKDAPKWYATVADRDKLNAAVETLRRRSSNAAVTDAKHSVD